MSQSEPPRRQEPYLSTEDIIQRVRITQGRAQPWQVFRGPLAALGAVVVTLGLLILLHRAREHEHQRAELEAASQVAAATDSPEPRSERTPSAGEKPSGEPIPSASSAIEAAPDGTPLSVAVAGRPGIIALDGRRLTVDRRWAGKVGAGRHQLTVRCGSLTLRRRVDIAREPVHVTFDCSNRRSSK